MSPVMPLQSRIYESVPYAFSTLVPPPPTTVDINPVLTDTLRIYPLSVINKLPTLSK